MKIVVVGAGTMGCLFGGALKESGQDVVLVDVVPKQIEAINSNGLIMERNGKTSIVKVPAKYAREVRGDADMIIVFTKTYHTEKALASVKHLIGRDTYALTVQNGLGNVEKISAFVDPSQIIVGMTNHPSDLIGPGHIRSTGKGHCKIMGVGGNHSVMVEAICRIMNEAGLDCEISDDIFLAIWEKVAFNTALNTIGAVLYLNNGGIGSVPEGAALAKNIGREVVMVANKKGIKVNEADVSAAIDNALRNHPHHICSMTQDVLAQRPTEIESLNGAVIREARNMGLPIPHAFAGFGYHSLWRR